MFMQNSNNYNINLNAKGQLGSTAFHDACLLGNKATVEVMINNAQSSTIDLQARDDHGKSGFQIAKDYRMKGIVKVIIKKMPTIAN